MQREKKRFYTQASQQTNIGIKCSHQQQQKKEINKKQKKDIPGKYLLKYRMTIAEFYDFESILRLKQWNRITNGQKTMQKEPSWQQSSIMGNQKSIQSDDQIGQMCSFMKQKGMTKHQQQILNLIRLKFKGEKSDQIQNLIKKGKISKASAQLQKLLNKKLYQFVIHHIENNFQENSSESIENPQVSVNENCKNTENEIEETNRIKQKQLLKKLEQKMGKDEEKNFKEVQRLLYAGKIKLAQQIITQVFGKKGREIINQVCQIFTERVNVPVPNAQQLKIKHDYDLKLYLLPTSENLSNQQQDIVNVLMVGMTGVGKSTYLNSLVNYFMGVEMNDDFRYIISRDALQNEDGKSSTTDVHIYGIPKQGKMRKAIRLIDVPGLADTSGIRKDKQHIQEIYDKIKKKILYINLIIYIFKASETRITPEGSYAINQIMSLFGKNVGENMLFVLTFADSSQPTVIKPLQASFARIIKKINRKNKEWYIKVNNSALFKKIDGNQSADVSYYKMGQECLQKTAELMWRYEQVSTEMTINVMEKRKQLEVAIEGFNSLIKDNFNKQSEIRQIVNTITENEIRRQIVNVITNDKAKNELSKMYNIQKTKNQKLLLELISDYSALMIVARHYCEKLKQLNQQLSKIQLRKDNHVSVVQYIELIIKNEENEKKEGYQNRIKQCYALKNYQERLEKPFKDQQTSQLRKFHDLMKSRIEELIPNKEIAKILLSKVIQDYQQVKTNHEDINRIRTTEGPESEIVCDPQATYAIHKHEHQNYLKV